VGSMISLVYYLRVIATMWMQDAPAPSGAVTTTGRPALAGGSAEATSPRADLGSWIIAIVFGAATLVLGIIPSPLFHLAKDAGAALVGLK
jgi:NADH-quinone oxidoreductase subunit N